MEVFKKLGIKIPNAILISGLTETERDEEVIDFLKRYDSINRLLSVNEPSSVFDQNLITEYNSETALSTLEPLLPYTLLLIIECTLTRFLP